MLAEPLEQSCPNPFDSVLARDHSTSARLVDGVLMPLSPHSSPVSELQEFVHDGFRALVLSPKFPCVAAKGAFHRGDYQMGLYKEMGSPEATAGLARDLWAFVQAQSGQVEAAFSTFVASFTGPAALSEEAFEGALWAQLQALHELDKEHSAWAEGVSADAEDANFGFSFAERAFFVIGLHPASTRWARRYAWPTLVFNAHFQFDRLKADGRYSPMQRVIRSRDMALQGSVNANLADFGERSEARQYSGRVTEDGWRCPFHATVGGGSE